MLTRARAALASPDALEHVVLLLAATAWVLLVTRASGGFHDPRTAVLAGVLVPALLLVRPWRHVPRWVLALPVAAAAGAVLVLALTPTGWMQADSVADQVLGLTALVVVAGYARTPGRRRAVLAVLAAALVITALLAAEPWFGSGDPNHLVTDPFGWHNQTGAFLAALSLVVATPAVLSPTSRYAGWRLLLAACGAGLVVLTTSRTTLGLLVVAWLLVGLRAVPRPRALLRWVAVPVLTVAVLLLGTSSLFFDRPWTGVPVLGGEGVSAAPDTGSRGTETIDKNGGDRVRWTVSALESFAASPVLGDGFGSFLATSDRRLDPGRSRSTFVHDAYAEALASGGLVFGLPLLAAALLVGVLALSVLWRGVVRRRDGDPLLLGTALGAGVLLLHSAVDFDAHYASLQVLLGVLGGLLVAAAPRPALRRVPPTLAATALSLTLALVALASLVEHHGRVVSRSGDTAAQLLDAQWPGLPDPRLQGSALAACLDGSGALAVPPEVARKAIDASANAASLLPDVRQVREKVQQALSGR